MSLRWKIFAIANYILLFIFLFLFIMAIRYNVKESSKVEDDTAFMIFTLSLFIIILNSAANIYIVHRHFPAKPFSHFFARLYLFLTILFLLALIVVSAALIIPLREELLAHSFDSYVYFMAILLFILITCGLFIFINQCMVNRHILRNSKSLLQQQIDDIGK